MTPQSIVNKLIQCETCCKSNKCYKCPLANAWDCNDKKIDLLKQLNNYIKGLNKNGNKTI